MKSNIVLTGFMGVGKTAVGKQLAQLLQMGFVDTDDLIEETGMKIPDIFRYMEKKVSQGGDAAQLKRLQPIVIV